MNWENDSRRQLVVYGPPMGKQRPKFSTCGKFVKAYTPDKTVNYETLVKLTYLEKYQGSPAVDKPLILRMVAWYQLPGSWSKKKREKALLGQIYPTVKPDLDNIVKIICDALNSLAYVDDKQIVELAVSKRYGDCPRVEIEMLEVADES